MNVLNFIYKNKDHSPVVTSDIPALNSWVKDGVSAGQIVEWGLRPGTHCKHLLLSFLRASAGFHLWCYNPQEKYIYPPSWASHNIQLDKTFFIGSETPVKDLRPLFLDNTFSFLIIDQPKKLSTGDWAFLQIQARLNKQVIFVLQPYYLNSLRGNPYASCRVNIKKNFYRRHFDLEGLKGTLAPSLRLTQEQIFKTNKVAQKGAL